MTTGMFRAHYKEERDSGAWDRLLLRPAWVGGSRRVPALDAATEWWGREGNRCGWNPRRSRIHQTGGKPGWMRGQLRHGTTAAWCRCWETGPEISTEASVESESAGAPGVVLLVHPLIRVRCRSRR